MKKFFALLIACLYLAVSSGVAVQIHHCMGKVSGITLVPSEKNKCDKCGMDKGAGKCCKDELKFVKLQGAYKLVTADYRLPLQQAVLDNNNHYLVDHFLINRFPIKEYSNHSPPIYRRVPICIMNCTFRV